MGKVNKEIVTSSTPGRTGRGAVGQGRAPHLGPELEMAVESADAPPEIIDWARSARSWPWTLGHHLPAGRQFRAVIAPVGVARRATLQHQRDSVASAGAVAVGAKISSS